MFSVSPTFFASFKIGDNIVYNLEILNYLYRKYAEESESNKKYLLKPIIFLLISIIEAILFDFNTRIKTYTLEGVKGLSNDIIRKIRNEVRDEFGRLISKIERHKLFNELGNDFINNCRLLVDIRNRVHIQNKYRVLEPDDELVFTDERKMLAEQVLEKLVKLLNSKHPRGSSYHHVGDLILPWHEHYPA